MYKEMIDEFINESMAAEAIASKEMIGEFALPVILEDDGFDLEQAFLDALGFGGESYANIA